MPGPGMTIAATPLAAAERRVDQDDAGSKTGWQLVMDELGIVPRDVMTERQTQQRRPLVVALVESQASAGPGRVRGKHPGPR